MTAVFNGFGEKAIPFLKALNFHQSWEWFQENRALFEQDLREPLGDLIDVLSERFGEAGIALKGDRKKSQFRINRDVRFSKDKRPYTDHVSAILSPDGTKMEQGVFFVHVGLERCFAAVAWWQPAPPLLQAMRAAVVEKPKVFRAMISALKKNGLEIGAEGRLKRAPRGFEAVTEPDLAAAVRNRHFVVRHEIEPERIHSPELADELFAFVLRARPLLDWGRAIEGRVPRS
ncbi:MAG: TIGR02453 family protein [Mesorhizobium sp.]|nr:TIGR02453 family protein [Mesorhizobium sp.]MBN9245113.1 TIGR02453 family protein [Mesorhizobium sp.]MBN9268915.1 TIGR02453 family protein [Mesorhizobium sp.]